MPIPIDEVCELIVRLARTIETQQQRIIEQDEKVKQLLIEKDELTKKLQSEAPK